MTRTFPTLGAVARQPDLDSQRSAARQTHQRSTDGGMLGRYRDCAGRLRDVVARSGAGGSVLVIDRDAATLADRRLVAHLAPDEPAGNAEVTCAVYLRDHQRGRSRRVSTHDLEHVPFAWEFSAGATEAAATHTALVDAHGCRYRLEKVASAGMTIPELRWVRRAARRLGGTRVVSVRHVVGQLQDYEPVRNRTALAVHLHRADAGTSVAVLRAELRRVGASRIVLNRGLREAVLDAISHGQLSMSQIAVRCDRVKHDTRGNLSGETSWLARRLGLLPESAAKAPTPWIHSDVLALIAVRGLGVTPREVELG